MAAEAGSRTGGLVVAAHGRRYTVSLDSGERLDCLTRGKRSEAACGDRVRVSMVAADQGVIEAVETRGTVFRRSDAWREKVIAANVTQVVVVVAASPSWHEGLLNRCLVAAEHAGVPVLVVLNKTDLPQAAAALDTLRPYTRLGYAVVPLCARVSVAPLLPHLAAHTSLLVGQSGMGKSTLVNALFPDAGAATGEISRALDSGRHTTTHATLYEGADRMRVIDSPGLQTFGLRHVPAAELDAAFPEFRPLIGRCRYANCRHLAEPGCAVEAALGHGLVAAPRVAAYRDMAAEAAR